MSDNEENDAIPLRKRIDYFHAAVEEQVREFVALSHLSEDTLAELYKLTGDYVHEVRVFIESQQTESN